MIVSKASTVLIAVATLALGAGLAVGTLSKRVIGPSAVDLSSGGGSTEVLPASSTGGSTLSQELGLSTDQRNQMQQIWEGVQTTAHDCQEKAQKLQKQRDDAVFDMLSDEQKAKYTQLTTECFGKIGLLNSQREAAFNKAVEQTKSILNDTQKKVYEQLIASRVGGHVSNNVPETSANQLAMQQ
jgi:hypothetical protein